MTKSRRWALFIAISAQMLWFIPAVIFGYKWLARDEPNVVRPCKGSSTCYSGETANIMLTSTAGAIALTAAGVTILVVCRKGLRPWHESAGVAARSVQAETSPRPSLQCIQELETLRASGFISEADYDRKRKQIVTEL